MGKDKGVSRKRKVELESKEVKYFGRNVINFGRKGLRRLVMFASLNNPITTVHESCLSL